jgi:hypothetical protein
MRVPAGVKYNSLLASCRADANINLTPVATIIYGVSQVIDTDHKPEIVSTGGGVSCVKAP